MLAQELIRIKRDGGALDDTQIQAFVQDSARRRLERRPGRRAGDGDPAARHDTRRDGRADARDDPLGRACSTGRARGCPARSLDKHSTGGVGDKVSLCSRRSSRPAAAWCRWSPAAASGTPAARSTSSRALPGYTTASTRARAAGARCARPAAPSSARARLAPADRRLYAIRDVTATVESVPLITASILSKKLAAGLQGLVMDVKVGNGAFTRTLDAARELAQQPGRGRRGAGLPHARAASPT